MSAQTQALLRAFSDFSEEEWEQLRGLWKAAVGQSSTRKVPTPAVPPVSVKDPGFLAAVRYLESWHVNGAKIDLLAVRLMAMEVLAVSDQARKQAPQTTSD